MHSFSLNIQCANVNSVFDDFQHEHETGFVIAMLVPLIWKIEHSNHHRYQIAYRPQNQPNCANLPHALRALLFPYTFSLVLSVNVMGFDYDIDLAIRKTPSKYGPFH